MAYHGSNTNSVNAFDWKLDWDDVVSDFAQAKVQLGV